MDVIIYDNELDYILSKNTNYLIPNFLINMDNNTGLYYLINYWNKYSDNIYLIIKTKYNNIVNYYLKKVIPEISQNVKIINYDKSDGSAYIINYLLVNDIIKVKNKNLLITNPYIIPEKNINFKELEKKNKSKVTKNKKENINNINNIIIFLNDNKLLTNNDNKLLTNNDNNDIINNKKIGIYYFENFKIFNLEQYNKNLYNEDIYVFFKDITSKINTYYLDNIIDYSDEDKLKNIILNKKIIFNTKYFNNIKIIDEERLFKSSNDSIGKELIHIETNWYKYLSDISSSDINSNNIKNLFPKIYEMYDYGFLMEYKKKYIPLSIYIKNNYNANNLSNNLSNILLNIFDKLSIIHNIKIIKEDKKIFLNNLKIEIYDKIINGKDLIESYYNKIEYVNNIKIDSLENILLKCKNIITQYYNSIDTYEYSIILGDCDFSNILINLDDIDDINFISPRGFFGNTKIYGSKEYDYAKLLYSIYGLDEFNNIFLNNYTFINDNSINIDFDKNIIFDKNILKKKFNKIHKAYMIIILLNLEYNKNNIWKCFILFYYGLYLGSTIL